MKIVGMTFLFGAGSQFLFVTELALGHRAQC
jgi:hypothetical protein